MLAGMGEKRDQSGDISWKGEASAKKKFSNLGKGPPHGKKGDERF